jgi:CBS domain-containing membrane protein
MIAGAALGVLMTAWLCHSIGAAAGVGWPWLVAPMGATAVLASCVPGSPMAQPWPVIGGNALSTLVGIACARWVGPPALAVAVAVSGAIAVMFAARCLHPPGGACALLAALAGVTDPAFALFPVLANSVLLVLIGLAYHRVTRRAPAPAPAAATAPRDKAEDELDADLDAVIARYNQVLDIRREDLKALLEDTQLRGYQRKLADIRCQDIMSRRLVTVRHDTPVPEAWAMFREHHIKALPVVDGAGGIVGIVTPGDFLRGAPACETVGQIMTRKVRVASVDRHLVELIPLFGGGGHHHIPIIDGGGRLVGVIAPSDVVAALSELGPQRA